MRLGECNLVFRRQWEESSGNGTRNGPAELVVKKKQNEKGGAREASEKCRPQMKRARVVRKRQREREQERREGRKGTGREEERNKRAREETGGGVRRWRFVLFWSNKVLRSHSKFDHKSKLGATYCSTQTKRCRVRTGTWRQCSFCNSTERPHRHRISKRCGGGSQCIKSINMRERPRGRGKPACMVLFLLTLVDKKGTEREASVSTRNRRPPPLLVS